MMKTKASMVAATAFAVGIALASAQTYAGIDFASIKAQADSTHTPLIVVYSNTDCHYCDLLKAIAANGIYQSWLSSNGYTDAWFEDDEEVKRFARNTSGRYPFVAVYWNRGEEYDTVCERFTGREGEMPVTSGTLMEQFMRSVDFILFKANATCSNDNFADATDFDSNGVSFGCSIGATAEEGEPLTTTWPQATTTVWWKWTAKEKCKATFDTVGSDFDTVMAVYTGDSLATLEVVAEDDDGAENNNASKVEFSATADTTYYIAVSGWNGAAGTILLNKSTEFIPTFTYEVLPEDNYLAGGAMITGVDKVPSRLEIPAEIDGYTVVAIAGSAFNWSQDLEEVVFPDTMVDIGSKAFAQCYELRRVMIPDGVTHLGNYAFWQCYCLESVTIGSGLTNLGKLTFGECYSLESVEIGNGLSSFGTAVFESCYSLESIILPSSVTSISWQVFKNCPSLTTVYMHDSLKSLRNKAWFENSPNATIQYYSCQTPVAPRAVAYLEASEDAEGVIEVSWAVDDDVEVSGYRLYRAMRPHFRFATLIAKLDASGSGEGVTYYDYDVSEQYTYCYWVIPVNDLFVGEISGVATGYCEDPFQITTVTLPSGTELEQYEQSLTVNSDNMDALGWYADGLPPGLSISGEGIISGMPTQFGTYDVTISCHDIDYDVYAEKEFTIAISENANRKPQISEASPSDGAYLLHEPGDTQTFSVTAYDPDAHDVSYTWIVDGEEIKSGKDSAYTLSTGGETPGARHDVICYVNDDLWENIVCAKWTIYLPQTLYVDAFNGSNSADGQTAVNALATLQAAIDRSADGDSIIVADGVYAPIETRNRRIVIESANGYRNAIIDGGGETNCALLGGPE